ncbi:MAG: PilZ domain-containing protein [Candidatus Eremiobacterota bacterium]
MTEEHYSGEQRRRFYRIKYPLIERPEIILDNRSYQVIDISEGGVKFFSPVTTFKVGDYIKGSIKFHDGEVMPVEGHVLRLQNKRVIILLDRKIPLQRILKEQRYLIKKYAGFR